MSKRPVSPAPRAGRAQAGLTLIEVVASLFVATIAVVMAAKMFVGAGQTADRSRALSSLGTSATTGTDEILYQLRGASQIATATLSVQGDSFTPSATQIAFYAPSINTVTQDIYTTNCDKIAFNYDATNQQITESLDPDSVASGNGRPTHRNFVIARNVSALTFKYYARNYCTATAAGAASCTLSTTYKTGTTPTVYVNGAPAGTGVIVAYATTKSVTTATITGAAANADIEIFYEVDPVVNYTGLKYVTEVDTTLTTSAPVTGDSTRSVTQLCRSRLRDVPDTGSSAFSPNPSNAYESRL